jgi:hypothetical protein
MYKRFYKIVFLLLLCLLIQSCEKAELEDIVDNNKQNVEEINYNS